MPLALGVPSLPALLIVLVVVLVVLGPKRLTGVGRSLGPSVRGFKDSLTGGDEPEDRAKTADGLRPAPLDDDAEETVTGEPVEQPRRTPRA